jgi:uncharacterized membrane protein
MAELPIIEPQTKLLSKLLIWARWLAGAMLIVLYALLVHHVNASGQATALGALLVILPFIGIGITLALNAGSRLAGVLLLLGTIAAAWWQWALIKNHTGFIFWMQDVSLLSLLLLTFGRTLLAGSVPLCVQFAKMLHGELTPEHERYAYQVTVAWTLFFAVMIMISSLLFFLAPLAVWSVFVNFMTLPLVGLMFLAEFLLRRRILSNLPPSHILDAVRAYLNRSARVH